MSSIQILSSPDPEDFNPYILLNLPFWSILIFTRKLREMKLSFTIKLFIFECHIEASSIALATHLTNRLDQGSRIKSFSLLFFLSICQPKVPLNAAECTTLTQKQKQQQQSCFSMRVQFKYDQVITQLLLYTFKKAP